MSSTEEGETRELVTRRPPRDAPAAPLQPDEPQRMAGLEESATSTAASSAAAPATRRRSTDPPRESQAAEAPSVSAARAPVAEGEIVAAKPPVRSVPATPPPEAARAPEPSPIETKRVVEVETVTIRHEQTPAAVHPQTAREGERIEQGRPSRIFDERKPVSRSDTSAVPDVQITIGRIEVRAVPAAAKTDSREAPKQQVMTLDDYLHRRERGAR